MSVEIRPITLQNLSDAVRVLNESSRGTSVAQEIDPVRFLALAKLWQFSYEECLLSYDDGDAVAIILNCLDRNAAAGYTYFWGAVPSIRSTRLALTLMETSCARLRAEGITTLYGDAVSDRPVKRYRFVHAVPAQNLLQMQATDILLPNPEAPFEIRHLEPSTIAALPQERGAFLHWTQRPNFAMQAAEAVQIFGAFDQHGLQAYVTVMPQSESTLILDLRSPLGSHAAGHALLRSLLAQKHQPPFIATNVSEDKYSHGIFSDAGFVIQRRYTAICRDLTSTT